ncbi:aldehyde dehydrogenase family protein [Streptomyces sp. W16]|uniref:aldehyde dehydrogenase family protein n=1 Tax=Streptomyces sp. W16 TaxID=3076631 RepID=UPI00295C364C|nr:aldehyde dehydrogenase family protein [Streptomyces sp. W16]MDV9173784.1 aldehyde dehydrogenase family protein [Streptomyces sp. W16]
MDPSIVIPRLPDCEPMLIGGEWTTGTATERIAVVDPATREQLTTVAQAGPAEVSAAVEAANTAHRDRRWRGLPPRQRRDILLRLADLVERDAEQLAVLDTLDNGKAVERARGDVELGLQAIRHFAGTPTRLSGTVHAAGPDRHVYSVREPVGVVAAVLPWNFPFMIAAWKLAPALAAGCTVVVKPAEQTPLTALRLAALCLEAGVPEGVVNVLTGDGRTGAELVAHPGVAKVSFTGSTEVGRHIMAAAAPSLKRLTLELGGKSPNIVFADADLDAAAPNAVRAVFGHSGQMCTAGSRLLVERTIVKEFLDRLVPAVEALRIGPGLAGGINIGPLVSQEQYDRVTGYVELGRSEGAEVAVSGELPDVPGWFVPPTVFTDVTPDMRIAREEIFGPVATILPFDSEEEAITLANDSEYGLAAGVWTGSLARAHRTAAALEAGTVWVNTYNEFDPAVAFGGMKQSGLGRDLGDAAVDGFTELKSVTIAL